MIEDGSKYFALSGDIPVGGPSTWHVTDWDQRRVISVTMDGEQDDESLAIKYLSGHSSKLPTNVYRIHVSPLGDITSTSTDPKDDQGYCVHYPRFEELCFPKGAQTIRRDELEELERLGPDVDLVAYPPCSASAKKVVFKYYFLWQYAQRSWDEMNLWMRLPHHPNIVPFDRVVLDELEGRVIGFTIDYVAGGALEENPSRIFQLKWLRQLIRAVDDLNLRYGISHQDVSPRNLVVDESTDSIMLLDFNFATRIKHTPVDECQTYREDRNDVKGVIFTVYEIITRDDSLRSVPHEEQNIDGLGVEWVKHPDVILDHPLETFLLVLREWRGQREKCKSAVGINRAPEAIDWPSRPKPPQKDVPATDWEGRPCSFTEEEWYQRRQDVRDHGGKVLNWERPPQELLDDKTRMLCTGKEAECQE